MQQLLFGNVPIAVPTAFKITHEKVLSSNAGLSSACMFVGDVKGMRTVIHIEWANLRPEQTKAINGFILDMQNMFFDMTYLNEEFETVTKKVRAENPTYEQWGWDKKRQLCRVMSVDLYAYSGVT